MPLAHVEWFTKESAHDSDKIHARQCCTYYSVTNVNKTNYPFLSSYEQEQTWTLTRTMSNNHKRYQSAIENIHLTTPTSSLKTKHANYENISVEKNRSIPLISPIRSSQDHTSSSSRRSLNSVTHQDLKHEQKTSPIKAITNRTSNSKNNSNLKKSRLLSRPMRVVHANGELIVRI